MLSINHHLSFTFLLILLVNTGISWAQNEVPRFEQVECPFQTDEPLEGVECGELVVYENREDPIEGTLRLAVAVLRSHSNNPAPDPLVHLTGGPGTPSLINVPRRISSNFWNRYRQKRDLIFFDQRGTGFSEPSFCEEMNEALSTTQRTSLSNEEILEKQLAATKSCREKMLAKGIDFSAYNSATSVRDLNDLRKTLVYEQWNLFGVSYGARLALTAMRDSPTGIRSVILDSPPPPNVRLWVDRLEKFNRSMNLVFEHCANSDACRETYPDLESDFYNLLNERDQNPIEIPMSDTTRFPDGKIEIDKRMILGGLFSGLYNPNFIPIIPLVIQEVQSENRSVLRALADRLATNPNRWSEGLQQAINCYEVAPFNPVSMIDSTKMEYPRITSLANNLKNVHALCDAWHSYRADSLEFMPVSSDIPTLVMNGEFDPVTPPQYGRITLTRYQTLSLLKLRLWDIL